ncbi:hypothetical protein MTBLM1_30299 [Rhodospirillaceae bacterium LM-1]|nr:hypothetical protein MTBLM1_30299 [Rhodospirillaceae bacterium LM-1]
MPDRIKPDFADMIRQYARQGLKPRIYLRPDGLYSLMADPEFFLNSLPVMNPAGKPAGWYQQQTPNTLAWKLQPPLSFLPTANQSSYILRTIEAAYL